MKETYIIKMNDAQGDDSYMKAKNDFDADFSKAKELNPYATAEILVVLERMAELSPERIDYEALEVGSEEYLDQKAIWEELNNDE